MNYRQYGPQKNHNLMYKGPFPDWKLFLGQENFFCLGNFSCTWEIT